MVRTGLQYDVFVMNADGTGLVNLTDSLAYDDWRADLGGAGGDGGGSNQ